MVQKEEQKMILRIEPDYNFTEGFLYMHGIFPIILQYVKQQGLNKDLKSIYHILILPWHDSLKDQAYATPAECTQQITNHVTLSF
jgi:hypothetical protein